MKNLCTVILLVMTLFMVTHAIPAFAQRKRNKAAPAAQEMPKPKEEKKSGMKPYSDVISAKAITDNGLFKVHKVEEKFYFEIPDSLLNREQLLITKISGFVENFAFGGAGMSPKDEHVIRWEKFDNRKVLLRIVSKTNIASEDLPIYRSVKYNNFEPILYSFDIQTIGQDSSSYVLDVSEFFTSDVDLLSPLNNDQRKDFGIKNLDKSRSLINLINSLPEYIEVRSILTYYGSQVPDNKESNSLSVEVNHSFVLLPKTPMKPRLGDPRVGYISVNLNDYGLDEQKTVSRAYITRWRLEPKDWQAYSRGELVEPIKPIIYYIDPATPMKWRKYLKDGVEAWQSSFEKIGFKNAIIAKDAPSPEEDPEWSAEDIRYSVIRYITTKIMNAQGPHVHDPRSGEIIESDILWYHNVMTILRCMYLVQTANVNPNAQVPRLSDEDMGRFIRNVTAHEVGHTLGLPHNMGASSAYPVDSLRSPTFTNEWGIAPSIMDYARANYVAQPGDGDVYLLNDKIGPYDDYSIYWGYKPIPEAKTADDEISTLNSWIVNKASDKIYRYGRQTIVNHIDPSSQTEDLGDDAVKAGTYGIQNLKRIVPQLIKWTSEPGKDYQTLREVYFEAVSQWSRYLGHAVHNIGGSYEQFKTTDQVGPVYELVAKDKQTAAMKFLNDFGFNTPTWLLDEDLLRRLEPAGEVERIGQMQANCLNSLLDPGRFARLIEAESLRGSKTYTIGNMLAQLRMGLWQELATGRTIDISKRNLQRAYIERMGFLMKEEQQNVPADERRFSGFVPIKVSQSEIRPYVRAELNQLHSQLKTGLLKTADTGTRYHIEDAMVRIENILNPK